MRATRQVLVSVLLFSPAALGVAVEAYDPSKDVVANARKQNDDPNRKWCHMKEVPNTKGGGWTQDKGDRDESVKACIAQCPHYNDGDKIHSALCGYAGGSPVPWDYKKGM
jgi:hypothetical protein